MENSWWTVNCVAGRTGNLPSQCRFLCFNGHGATSAGASEAIGGKRGPEAPVRRGASSGRDGEFRRQRTLRCRRGSVPSVTACFCSSRYTQVLFLTHTNSNFNLANETKHACKTVKQIKNALGLNR